MNGVAKLADIGLVTGIDATRSFVGTEGFAAPEGPGTPQADIYSLGKVLYEISTGKDRQDFPELPTNLDALSDREALMQLNAVMAKACREDPRDRYPSARAMHQELLLLQSGKSVARLHAMQRTIAQLKRVSIGIALLTLVAVAAWFYQSEQTRKVEALASANATLAQRAEASAQEARENELRARQNLYAADISLAQQALANDNLRQAKYLLEKQRPEPGEPDLRSFEWHYLWNQSQGEELFTLEALPFFDVVEISPDGRTIGSAGPPRTVMFWDVESRNEIAEAHKKTGTSIAFSPDGEMVVTASNTEVVLSDARTFKILRYLPEAILDAKFSHEGRYLLTGYTNGLILWNTKSWTIEKRREQHGLWRSDRQQIHALSRNEFGFNFSLDGTRVGIVSDQGIHLLTVPELAEEKLFSAPMALTRFVAFSPDGRTIATSAAPDNFVQIWDLHTARRTHSIAAHKGTVNCALFSPDGKTLVTGSSDQTIRFWDPESGSLRRVLKGHTAEVASLSFSGDGKVLVSASSEGTLKLWNPTETAAPKSGLVGIYPLGFTTPETLAGLTPEGKLGAFELKTLEKISETMLRNPRGDTPYRFSARYGFVFAGRFAIVWPLEKDTPDGPVVDLLDLAENRLLCSVENAATSTVVRSVAFAPERLLLATTTPSNTVTIWQVPRGDGLGGAAERGRGSLLFARRITSGNQR